MSTDSKIYSVNITRTGHIINRLCEMHPHASCIQMQQHLFCEQTRRSRQSHKQMLFFTLVWTETNPLHNPPSLELHFTRLQASALNRELAAGSLSLSHSWLRTHYPQSQAVGGLSVKMIYFRNKYSVSLCLSLSSCMFMHSPDVTQPD